VLWYPISVPPVPYLMWAMVFAVCIAFLFCSIVPYFLKSFMQFISCMHKTVNSIKKVLIKYRGDDELSRNCLPITYNVPSL